MKGLTCTVLMENTGLEGLACEHGLSFHIRYGDTAILLDGGASGAFAENAKRLGLDLGLVDWAALSHGHYDHADGLRAFLACNPTAPIYMRETAPSGQFANRGEGYYFVGINRDLWREMEPRTQLLSGGFQPMEGVWILPETVHGGAFASQEKNLYHKDGEDDFSHDDFSHEQSLVFETEDGLVLFNSCSHGGIVNIVQGVLDQLPGKTVTTVVGGFHMYSPGIAGSDLNCAPEYVTQVAGALMDMGVKKVYTGHCTGNSALALLRQAMGDGVHHLTGGLVIEL